MIFKNRKNIFYVEIGIILLSGIGGLFALISVCFRGSWISREYFDQIHMHRNRDHLTKCEASCWLAIIGTICCVTSSFIGALRMRYCNFKETKKYKTAQFINSIAGFISLLSSVSVWADYLCHFPYELTTTDHLNKLTYNQHKQTIKNRKILISQSNDNQTIISTISSMIHLSQLNSRLQIDTASDVTILSRKSWIKMGRPRMVSTTQKPRTACGSYLRLLGQLHCEVSFRDSTFAGIGLTNCI
ncbi:unnamed protein product [Schistosoma rodhaini]|uniref:Uncharacterized protein n=1 Tax=Schistosoma rodhaini TaxID=6188 RepID=A0AA85FFX9_9TREM|nr:unnamed protein product [Schistosoma rodhaini]